MRWVLSDFPYYHHQKLEAVWEYGPMYLYVPNPNKILELFRCLLWFQDVRQLIAFEVSLNKTWGIKFLFLGTQFLLKLHRRGAWWLFSAHLESSAHFLISLEARDASPSVEDVLRWRFQFRSVMWPSGSPGLSSAEPLPDSVRRAKPVPRIIPPAKLLPKHSAHCRIQSMTI